MGLTIHYDISFKGGKVLLQKALEQIRQKCLDMPFKEVGEVETKEITKQAWQDFDRLQRKFTYPNNTEENLALRDKFLKDTYGLETWDFIMAGDMIPTTQVGLFLWPDGGCEDSSLKFLKRGNRYKCSAFCKTQYAEHFVRSHLLVVSLLDLVKSMKGFTVQVCDEGEYWKTRNIELLAKNINDYTTMIQGIFDSIPEELKGKGMEIESPITDSANYVKINGEIPVSGDEEPTPISDILNDRIKGHTSALFDEDTNEEEKGKR